jgi:chitinase
VRSSKHAVVAVGAAAVLAAAGTFVTVAAHAASGVSRGWYGAAAYVMPFDNSPPDLPSVMGATGQKTFELAFILSNGGCSAAWDGTIGLGDPAASAAISGVRNAGGDVSVSFGGYGGTKLGQVCGDPQATANAYQAVIDRYGIKAVDFDLEEPEYENAAAIHNEIGAAKLLQQNNPGLYVSITTAGTTGGEGTGYFGKQMLLEARNSGLTPDNYAIMPFDGGFSTGAPAQIAALEGFHSTLMSTFGWDSATAYGREGVSLMNGRSDTGEMFHQSDFQAVLDYARAHNLTRYTYWSVNRDRQCSPPDNNGTTSGTCSSVPQNAWDYTRFTATFGGAVPPPPPPPSPTPSASPPGGTCTAPMWNASAVYVGGNVVSYQGHQYTAKWWTTNEQPDTHSGQYDVWTDNGPCSGGPPNPPPPSTSPPNPPPSPSPTGTGQFPAWQADHAYVVGDRVSYAGHDYQCRQSHTSQVGWEPPNVPALWLALN